MTPLSVTSQLLFFSLSNLASLSIATDFCCLLPCMALLLPLAVIIAPSLHRC
jgi:hypothetical protein